MVLIDKLVYAAIDGRVSPRTRTVRHFKQVLTYSTDASGALISRVKELIDAGADAKEERAASISGCSTQPVNHFDRFAR